MLIKLVNGTVRAYVKILNKHIDNKKAAHIVMVIISILVQLEICEYVP